MLAEQRRTSVDFKTLGSNYTCVKLHLMAGLQIAKPAKN
jgi:hypothetical protein